MSMQVLEDTLAKSKLIYHLGLLLLVQMLNCNKFAINVGKVAKVREQKEMRHWYYARGAALVLFDCQNCVVYSGEWLDWIEVVLHGRGKAALL